jgi:hypothetical protein
MLAEKFFLLLETLRSHAADDRPHVAVSTSPHVPVRLLRRKQAAAPTQATQTPPPPLIL